MKVLTLGQFDPCGYHLRHRKWMKARGVDYRFAVQRVYRAEGRAADWVVPEGDPVPESLRAFARDADVVQVLPGINQDWSYQSTAPRFDEFQDGWPPGMGLLANGDARRVALFHGSLSVYHNADAYADEYRKRGMAIAATTLDYVVKMKASYVPALVEVDGRSDERKSHERLKCVHAPTDVRMCSTEEFKAVANSKPMQTTLVTGLSHATCLEVKRQHHVGFDHLRGAFSINSLENASLGLVNLVGMTDSATEALDREMSCATPWPKVQTIVDVDQQLDRLCKDAALTADYQRAARRWFLVNWAPEKIAAKVERVYRAI